MIIVDVVGGWEHSDWHVAGEVLDPEQGVQDAWARAAILRLHGEPDLSICAAFPSAIRSWFRRRFPEGPNEAQRDDRNRRALDPESERQVVGRRASLAADAGRALRELRASTRRWT